MREFGFVNPVIIDRDYNVIAGHGRIAAAREEGITEVPCVFVDHLTEAQKKAYILADNRMALDAGWDEKLLRVEMEALTEMGYDLGLTGFDEKELADLFPTEEAKPDGAGKHPWKAEVTEGDAAASVITGWYKNVYEPSYTAQASGGAD